VRGYRLLTQVQTAFPGDVDVLNAFGTALLAGNQPREAKFAFDRVLALDPANPIFQENAGGADLACGDLEAATRHLEKALELDPLLLSAAGILENIYKSENDTTKQAALAARIRQALTQAGTEPRPEGAAFTPP
jgi:Tfp pilus assembly protein PilF